MREYPDMLQVEVEYFYQIVPVAGLDNYILHIQWLHLKTGDFYIPKLIEPNKVKIGKKLEKYFI